MSDMKVKDIKAVLHPLWASIKNGIIQVFFLPWKMVKKKQRLLRWQMFLTESNLNQWKYL